MEKLVIKCETKEEVTNMIDILINYGIKIKPECDDDLVGAIKTIKNKYDFYVGRAKKGREFVIKNYMRETIMKNYVDTLEKSFLLKQE